MKIAVVFIWLMFVSLSSHAIPTCVEVKGNFPHWVYETTSQLYLGISGYATKALCEKAIRTADPRIACASVNVPGSFGSGIINTANGTLVGYQTNYYASVNFCSTAIGYSRGGTVCIPGPAAGNVSNVTLFDFVNWQTIGTSFSSVEFCKYASLSASASGHDPYICAMNSLGNTQIMNRQTAQWFTHPNFMRTQECYRYLAEYRNGRN